MKEPGVNSRVSNQKISIVSPSFNQGKFIGEAIESVLDQKYPNFEHIVIDAESTDNTLNILESYPHLTWISEPDDGQADALNKGFRMATGEIVGWLNTDDLYLPGCFQTVAAFFDSHPDIDIAYGDYRWIDEAGHVLQFRQELEFDPFMLKYLNFLHIHSAATFFRRKIFEGGEFLDISYHYAMDYEFFLRLLLKGYRFAHVEGFLADFRVHEKSKTSVDTDKGYAELQTALLELDPFLARISHPGVKQLIRKTFMIIARGKRIFLKSIRGHYFSQWTTERTALQK